MRVLKALANILVVLAVAGLVPDASAFDRLAGSSDRESSRRALQLDALSPGRLPAEVTARRGSARVNGESAERSSQSPLAIVSRGPLHLASHCSDGVDAPAFALRASASYSPSPVRGPPPQQLVTHS